MDGGRPGLGSRARAPRPSADRPLKRVYSLTVKKCINTAWRPRPARADSDSSGPKTGPAPRRIRMRIRHRARAGSEMKRGLAAARASGGALSL